MATPSLLKKKKLSTIVEEKASEQANKAPISREIQSTPTSSGGTTTTRTGSSSPSPTTSEPKVFRNDAGNLSGVEINGRTFLGLQPQTVKDIVEADRLKRQTPQGSQEVSQVAAGQELQRTQENLKLRQAQETQQVTNELFQPQQDLSLLERTAQAGLILPSMAINTVADSLNNALGTNFQKVDAQQLAKINATKAIGYPLGLALSADLFGFNLGNTLGLGKDISNIEQDVTDLETSSSDILENVRNGGSIIAALNQMDRIEDSIRSKQGALQMAIQRSPKDIAEGKSGDYFIGNALVSVQNKKQAIERLQATGDYAQFEAEIGRLLINVTPSNR